MRAGVIAALISALAACSSTPGSDGAPAPAAKLGDAFAKPDWATVDLGTRKQVARAITPDDLIGSDGACAATRVAAPEQPPQGETEGAGNVPPVPVQQGPTIVGGIALAMTECEVAQRAGFPGNVEIGAEAGGERSAVLTYRQGPWPGIYRFRGGRLVSIERVEVVEQPKPKKQAKPAKPPTRVNLRSSTAQ